MNGDLLSILAAVIFLLLSGATGKVGKSIRKAMKEAASEAGSSSAPKRPVAPTVEPTPTPHTSPWDMWEEAWETTEEDMEPTMEQSDPVSHIPEPEAVDVDILGNKIYSYETADSMEDIPTAHPMPKEEMPKAESEVSGFDLRQAVIYQTILQNKYIPDWK